MNKLTFYFRNAPKYLFNFTLQKIFNFHPWHVSSLNSRKYCLEIIEYINSRIVSDELVVEMGCGLGETLNKIKSKRKLGLDTSKEVVRAARYKYAFSRMKIAEGSFSNVENLNIKYLLAVNFLHDFNTNQVKAWFEEFLSKNSVENIIVDELDDPNYFCLHNFRTIIPLSYDLKIISRTLLGQNNTRKILCFTKLEL